MAELWPILTVVAIWILVFIASFWSYARWLRVPTETEMEVKHEHGHDAPAAESAAAAIH